MSAKDLAFDRIQDFEKSLAKMRRTYLLTSSHLTLARYAVNYQTYLLNIKIFNEMSGQSYEPRIEAVQ